jgi:hypothetical protein
MKLKKDLHVNLKWNGIAGHCDEKVVNFPLKNGMKCDFNVVVNVVCNHKKEGYELLKIDVYDLIVHKDDDYVTISDRQLVDLVVDIQDKTVW